MESDVHEPTTNNVVRATIVVDNMCHVFVSIISAADNPNGWTGVINDDAGSDTVIHSSVSPNAPIVKDTEQFLFPSVTVVHGTNVEDGNDANNDLNAATDLISSGVVAQTSQTVTELSHLLPILDGKNDNLGHADNTISSCDGTNELATTSVATVAQISTVNNDVQLVPASDLDCHNDNGADDNKIARAKTTSSDAEPHEKSPQAEAVNCHLHNMTPSMPTMQTMDLPSSACCDHDNNGADKLMSNDGSKAATRQNHWNVHSDAACSISMSQHRLLQSIIMCMLLWFMFASR